jgi:hypothetical protein
VDLTDDCVTLSFCNSRGLPWRAGRMKKSAPFCKKATPEASSKYLHPEIKGDNIAHDICERFRPRSKKGT